MRRILRTCTIAMMAIAASTAWVVPARAAGASAIIQRGLLLAPYMDSAPAAYIIPNANRLITLARGRYTWTNQFLAAFPGTSLMNSRTIDLAAGEYQWNCYVDFVPQSESGYESKCYLIRNDTGDWAWTARLDVVVRSKSWFTWQSQLKPV